MWLNWENTILVMSSKKPRGDKLCDIKKDEKQLCQVMPRPSIQSEKGSGQLAQREKKREGEMKQKTSSLL